MLKLDKRGKKTKDAISGFLSIVQIWISSVQIYFKDNVCPKSCALVQLTEHFKPSYRPNILQN